MHHAVILASDRGRDLNPLTSEATPTAFLALWDRRTLLQQTVDRLVKAVPPPALWVLVEERLRERAEEVLPEHVHVIGLPGGEVLANDLAHVLREILVQAPGAGGVLIQPASHAMAEEAIYVQAVAEALDRAVAEDACTVLLTDAGASKALSTGVEAWPLERLLERMGECSDGSIPWREAVAPEEARQAVRLGHIGWMDLSTWNGVRQRLAYVEKPWGYERLWALTSTYAGKILFIRQGETLSLQYHERKDETIRVLSGRMRFRAGPSIDALETVFLDAGMSYAIPPRLVHQMEAVEDCTVVEVSTPHLADVIRLEDRYGRI